MNEVGGQHPSDPRLVACQPCLRAPRTGAGDDLGRSRACDGRQGDAPSGPVAQAARDPRAHGAGRDRRDRRARHHPARRPLAEPRHRRHRRSLLDGLPAPVHRPRRRRRLPGRAARPQLLLPQANRSAALAQGAPGDGGRIPARARPRIRRGHRRLDRLVPLVGHADRAADRRPLRLPRALVPEGRRAGHAESSPQRPIRAIPATEEA